MRTHIQSNYHATNDDFEGATQLTSPFPPIKDSVNAMELVDWVFYLLKSVEYHK